MTNSGDIDWVVVEQIYQKVSDLPEPKQMAALREECKDHPEIFNAIVDMLATIGEDALPASPALPPNAKRDPLIGSKIGSCTIKRVIGSGGMGTVYEAMQEKPRRRVALKMMKRGITSRSAFRRFEFESQTLARLQHPGVAQVYEAGTHDDGSGGVPYFVMEYIANAKSLTQYANEKKLGTKERLTLFAKVCEAVQHGHLKGIVHRDLKPGNILVDANGQPKVIDFGVARSTDSDMAVTTLQTDVGQLIGTLQYMSPEQCEADPSDIDPRSDVYTLGVILYELLIGNPPYDLQRMAIHEAVRIVREEEPTKLSTIDRHLRGDIETITIKALEKDRDRRYQSAIAFEQDIQHYLSNEPIHARPPSMSYQFSRFARRNRSIVIGIATVFIVLVGGIVATGLALARTEQAEADVKTQLIESKRQLAQVNFLQSSFRTELEERLGGGRLGLSFIKRFFTVLDDLKIAVGHIASDEPDEALRLLENIVLSLQRLPREHSSLYKYSLIAREKMALSWRMKGQLDSAIEVARACYEDTVREYGLSDERSLRLQQLVTDLYYEIGDEKAIRTWSSASSNFQSTIGMQTFTHQLVGQVSTSEFLVSSEDGLFTVNVDSQIPKQIISYEELHDVKYIASNPARSLLAISRKDGVIEIRDLAGGVIVGSAKIAKSSNVKLLFSPDGTEIAILENMYSSKKNESWVVIERVAKQLAETEPISDEPNSQQAPTSLKICSVPELEVLRSRRLSPSKTFGSDEWRNCDWEGNLLAIGIGHIFDLKNDHAWGATLLIDQDTLQIVRTVASHGSFSLALNPNGKLLAICNYPTTDELTIINTETGKTHAILPRHTNWITALDFSGDGRWFASGAGDGRVVLWDTSTWEPRASRRIPHCYVHKIEFLDSKPELAVWYKGLLQVWNLDSFIRRWR